MAPKQPLFTKQQINRALKAYGNNRPAIQRVLTAFFIFYIFNSTYHGLASKGGGAGKAAKRASSKRGGSSRAGGKAVEVDAVFFQRLKKILKIVIPSFRSKETFLLALHSFFLVTRTIISLRVADLDGRIVSSLVRAQPRLFLKNLLRWTLIAIPATYTNSMLDYCQSALGAAYRTRLTEKVMQTYLANGKDGNGELVYYKIGNLDDRIKNVDQQIVVDISRFSNHLSEIYSNIAKPVLDVVLFNYQLSLNVGAEGLVLLTLLVQSTSHLLRFLTPPFGSYASTTARLEGELRFTHSRLIENAEEVALYNGEEVEMSVVERSYFALVKHLNWVGWKRAAYAVGEEGIVKWLWGSFGLGICAIPVFSPLPLSALAASTSNDLGSRTEGFVTNRRLLLSASDAFGRVMYSYKELSELAGYTQRVSELLDVMADVSEGKNAKRLVSSAADGVDGNREVLNGRGEVTESEDGSIVFDKVPIVSPNGDVLVKEMSFRVDQGRNLLIVGPNGCGKSSLFRILGGLWPVHGGLVSKPPTSSFTYIPQRPYLSLSTLRDQITYPSALGSTEKDDELMKILEVVEMGHLVAREGGWESRKEWTSCLSGGDKQRIAMARLFYHKPMYAILDECTSGVTLEVERKMYEHATELGITMLTVSHRPSLWKYHQTILQFDGQGAFIFAPLDAEKRLAFQEKRDELEKKIMQAPKLEERLKELRGLKLSGGGRSKSKMDITT